MHKYHNFQNNFILTILVSVLVLFCYYLIAVSDIHYLYSFLLLILLFVSFRYLFINAKVIVYLSIILMVFVNNIPNDVVFFETIIFPINIQGLVWGCLGLLSIWFFLQNINKLFYWMKAPPFLLFILFFIYSLFSLVLTKYSSEGIPVLMHRYIPIGISFIISIILLNTTTEKGLSRFLKKIIFYYLLTSFALIMFGYYQLILNFTEVFSGGYSAEVSVTGAFKHRLVFGNFLIPLFYLLITIYRILFDKKVISLNKTAALSFVIIVFILIIFNNSRMIWISFFSSLSLYLLLDKKYFTLVILFFILTISYYFIPNFEARIGLITNISNIDDWWSSPVFSTLQGRIYYWLYSIESIENVFHFLFGKGIGFADWYFPNVVYFMFGVNSPHNEYLNFFLDFGLIGTLLYFSTFLYFLIDFSIRIMKPSSTTEYILNLTGVCLIVSFLVSCITNNLIRHTSIVFFYYIFFYIVWALNVRRNMMRKNNQTIKT